MPLTSAQEESLDNMPWFALNTIHAPFAEGDGPALKYRRSMAVFCGTARLDPDGWRALGDLVKPGRAVVLFQPTPGPIPDDYEEVFRSSAWQMVADGHLRPRPVTGETPELVELGDDDVDEMLELTALAEPGPFFQETHLLGTYLGVRENGRLVAMAGERLRTDHVAEISAVSTHPDVRRRGLGGLLTMAMVDVIRSRGDLAMLHVAKTNDAAIPLYEQLGFRIRGEVESVAARRPDVSTA
jgi:ribosomal protein S18 acetylase RimI-like enzyme